MIKPLPNFRLWTFIAANCFSLIIGYLFISGIIDRDWFLTIGSLCVYLGGLGLINWYYQNWRYLENSRNWLINFRLEQTIRKEYFDLIMEAKNDE